MNYPVWQLAFAGGGLPIAVIAVLHVFISHFAVGGGLFLVMTEIKGTREGDAGIISYVKRHTRIFMLVTMVLGALTGVGIWFTISLLNPSATSVLIHNFVFAWAVEWLFFFIEVLSLVVYYHTFERLSARTHQLVGWIYFGSAWLSLFIINGMVSFMLTPGKWLLTGRFFDGFFNPTFWPALFFRTALALIFAGLFGFVTATFLKNGVLKKRLVRHCAIWLLAPFVLLAGSAFWYRAALPPELEQLIFMRMPGREVLFNLFAACSVLLLAGGLLMAVRVPERMSRILAVLMLIIGLSYIGSFEFIREKGRKPFVINQYMFSNSILKGDLQAVRRSGVLARGKWVSNQLITSESRRAAGEEVFKLLCLSCHSVGGPFNDILKKTTELKPRGIKAIITTMGSDLRPYMPPFPGNAEEADALVVYLTDLHRR